MAEQKFEVFIPGSPAPGGSKRAFPVKAKPGRFNIVDSGGKRTMSWRESVRSRLFQVWGRPPLARDVAVAVRMRFFLRRPQAHFGRSGIKTKAIFAAPTTKPDVLKLARSTEDALTGLVWIDDAQNVILHAEKYYTNDGKTGCQLTVTWEGGDATPAA